MDRNTFNLKTAVLLVINAVGGPAVAADVTPERLLNVNTEPQNWLMNHRTYDGQRFSPLDRINASNVKALKLAYAVPLAGATGSEYSEATPLVENGFIYVTDSWGVLYKIDGTSGDVGRIMWQMDPKQEKQANNRGAAFWRNLLRRDAKVLGRCSTFDLAIESGGVPIVNYRIACAGPAWFDDTVVILSFY